MSGYIKIYRSQFTHPLFGRERFCRGFAWQWMIAHAAFREQKVYLQGRIITLSRGQFTHSIRFMADAWNWDKAAVSRYVARLKTEAMIETATDTGQLVITICNYDKYQDDIWKGETGTETQSETEMRQQRDRSETNKNTLKKEKKEKKKEEEEEGAIEAILASAVSRKAAADFILHRVQLRKPLTLLAASRMAERLKKCPDPDRVVNLSIENGWQGIFPDRVTGPERKTTKDGEWTPMGFIRETI